MTKARTAQALTVVVLLAGVGIGLARKTSWHRGVKDDQQPQDAIYAMLNASRSGDVKAYLACFTGSMQAAVHQALSETSEPAFAAQMIEANSNVKGVAVSDPQPAGDGIVKVRVEYVYQDHNASQTAYLEKGPAGWKVSRIEGDQQVMPPVPYGTAVK